MRVKIRKILLFENFGTYLNEEIHIIVLMANFSNTYIFNNRNEQITFSFIKIN